MISVILPTITGRERHYERAYDSYTALTQADIEIITVRNFDGCGAAWNHGAALARGEYLHFTADDLEPHDGWDTVAIETIFEDGLLPAPVVYRPDGSVESAGGVWNGEAVDKRLVLGTCVVPFFPRAEWERIGPIIQTHYFTDNFFSDQARRAGWEIAMRTGYAFTHHWAMEGRGDEDERMKRDLHAYELSRASIDWRCPDCKSGLTKIHMHIDGPRGCGKPPGYWSR